MRVLVAGGAGFIGSHLVERLLEGGHDVVVVDSLLTGSLDKLRFPPEQRPLTFVQADISQDELVGLLHGHGPFDAIFHLASPASPVGYWTYPFETVAANTTGTKNLLDIARRDNAKFLFTSTSEAYGQPLVHPQPETYFGNVNPVGVRAVYDESKRLGETLALEYNRRYGTDTRVVRVFNTIGTRNDLDDGRMVPEFVRRILHGLPLEIHGDGSQTRSLCYVSDTVDGIVRALFTAGTTGEVVNLGNQDERSVLEWAQTAMKVAGHEVPVVFTEKRSDDPDRRCPDITKARTLLGWNPKVTPEEGLRLIVDWARTQLSVPA